MVDPRLTSATELQLTEAIDPRLTSARIKETEAPVTRDIRVAVPIEKTDPGNVAD